MNNKTFRGQLLKFSLIMVGVQALLSLLAGCLLYFLFIPELTLALENNTRYLLQIFSHELDVPTALENRGLTANKVKSFVERDFNFEGITILGDQEDALFSQPEAFSRFSKDFILDEQPHSVVWSHSQLVSWSTIEIDGLPVGKLILAHSGHQVVNMGRFLIVVAIAHVLITFVFIILSFRFSNALVTPLRELTDFAIRIGQGTLEPQLDIKKQPKEVQYLTNQMNLMATQLSSKQMALVDARLDAEAASDIKSRFLANMSHEMRTPLNGVLGMTESLLEAPHAQNVRDDLQIVYSSARSLLDIIEDVLDISKIEAGAITVEKIECNLADIIRTALMSIISQVRRKKLTLHVDLKPNVPQWIKSDPTRIRQIILNLLSNAIKFSDQGQIKLDIGLFNDATLKISVSDNGVGMTESQLKTVFTAFKQADVSTTRKFGGTGLGLTISRSLAQLLGGDLTAQSTYRKGSTFTLSIPVVDKSRQKASFSFAVLGSNDFIRRMSRRLVTIGAEFMTSPSDAAIVIVGGDTADIFRYEQIGLTLGRLEMQNKTIVGVTQVNQWGSRHPMYALGVKDILLEPVFAEEVIEYFAKIEHSQLKVSNDKPIYLDKYVLVAEDNPVNQKVITRALAQEGVNVIVVSDGSQAVEAVQTNDSIQLVFMDLQMPVMDGLEATRRIRETHPDLPIVALTGDAVAETSKHCLAAGMNGFLTKPLRRELLTNQLSSYLS